ncbi:MAG: hypothetical protein GC164_14250 [Phycisphaera sp.]|nr:hypothetical protein [Phycisphaera sp.]
MSIPLSWLTEAVTVEEIDTDVREGRMSGGAQKWEAHKAKMRPGDELRVYASPLDSWQHLAGRAGIALVRNGRVVDDVLTMLN